MRSVLTWKSASLYLFFCVSCLTSPLYAIGDSQEPELLSLPLEELSKIQVVTASKTKESVQDSPGIVEVITQDDIQRLGATSLAEVLDHATSLFSLGTVGFPLGPIRCEEISRKVISCPEFSCSLTVGRFVTAVRGETMSQMLFGMPLPRIARVEIVRGPGSVLYGTNAYIGIINVITQSAKDQKTLVQAEYGSYNTRYGNLAVGREVGDLKIAGGGTVLATQGWNFNLVDEQGVQNAIPLASLEGGGELNLEYKGLTFHNFVGFINQDDVGIIPIWQNPIDFEGKTARWISDLGYTRQFAKNWKGSFNLTYNMLRLEGAIPVTSANQNSVDEKSDDFQIETTHFIQLSDAVDLTVGGTINLETGSQVFDSLTSQGQPFNVLTGTNTDPLVAIPFYRRALYQLYAQAEYGWSDDLKFIAGGQLNKAPNLDVNLVPRLGAVLDLDSGFGSKILYGQAYRSATGAENFTDEPGVLLGNDTLQPETITTFEVQSSYRQKAYNVALTYFNSHQKNVISRTFPPGVSTTINEGKIDSQGVELEGRGNPVRILTLTGGLTYEWLSATSRNSSGTSVTLDNPTGMPLTELKFGATVNPWEALRVSIFDNYFGNFGNTNAEHPNADPPVKDFHDVSMNLEYQASKNFKVTFSAKNVFSEPVYYPEILRHVINSIPGRLPSRFTAESRAPFKK